jgi:hypothetical protein
MHNCTLYYTYLVEISEEEISFRESMLEICLQLFLIHLRKSNKNEICETYSIGEDEEKCIQNFSWKSIS